MRRALIVVAGAVLAGVLVRAPIAAACSCIHRPVRDHVQEADVVFVGLATSVEGHGSGAGIARFTVHEVYKGTLGTEAILRTLGDTCAVEFIPGGRYVVFAGIDAGQLRETSCSGTTEDVGILKRAGMKPERLEGAKPPSSAPSLTAAELATIEGPSRSGVIAAAALFFAATALASFLARGRLGPLRRRPV